VTALLLLVVSPVTAPFLTYDLGALLDGRAPQGFAVLNSKKAQDEPVAQVAGAPVVLVPLALAFRQAATLVARIRSCEPIHVPLRL
jgi:hypothetical protein